MDSQLMNVFHDEPFDGNYMRYDENDEHFWPNEADTIDMQLTETLHGILPIAPTDDASIIYGDEVILLDDCTSANDNKMTLSVQGGNNVKNFQVLKESNDNNGTDSELSEVEAAFLDDLMGDDDDDDDQDDRSQCSASTFRTRTDSSSIGDYESHPSDYDDWEFVAQTSTAAAGLIASDDLGLNAAADCEVEISQLVTSSQIATLLPSPSQKNRTLSTNTIGSDIDANVFDLAEFITKDDFALSTASMIPAEKAATPKASLAQSSDVVVVPAPKPTFTKGKVAPVMQLVSAECVDSDTESDIIVDVETVDIESEDDLRRAIPTKTKSTEAHEDVPYVDNVKSDPSWSPKHTMATKQVKGQQVAGVNLQQSGKRKGGKVINGRSKVAKKQQNVKTTTKTAAELLLKPRSLTESKTKAGQMPQKVGLGSGGKNLALVKQELANKNANQPAIKMAQQAAQKPKEVCLKGRDPRNEVQATPAVKRKLNIEEYKMRRGTTNATPKAINSTATTTTTTNSVISKINAANAMSNVTPAKHSEAVTSIVRSLKENMAQNQSKLITNATTAAPSPTDPITEARNKVLRMQQLKRAQQMKIIDSTISAKVPRITKLPPLQEMVKGKYSYDDEQQQQQQQQQQQHPNHQSEYEELISVSAGCNTNISIPPVGFLTATSHGSRSLLKSSTLLHNISNTFQRVQAQESVKISTSSLITSIQDVVVKQALPVVETVTDANTNKAAQCEQHGENKIIMHLAKDRIRRPTATISTQTDFVAEFPALSLPPATLFRKSRSHVRRKYRRSKRSGSAKGNSSAATDSRDESADSCASSAERGRHYDTVGSCYSSRSSRRHRSSVSSTDSERVSRSRRQRRTSYKRRSSRARSRSASSRSSSASMSDCSQRSDRGRSTASRSRSKHRNYYKGNNHVDRNVSAPAVEERRIVYVGRIEQETTKEMLRRKFLAYGSIKLITIHYKENGMKYGFVTYERPEDAFAVIDNGSRDAQINMYDISFGGRRAFCRSNYADLDNAGINTYQSYVFPQVAAPPKQEDSFEMLLRQVKQQLGANKTAVNNSGKPSANNA